MDWRSEGWKLSQLAVTKQVFSLSLDQETFTHVHTQLGADRLDGGVDLLLVAHQRDPKLDKLV